MHHHYANIGLMLVMASSLFAAEPKPPVVPLNNTWGLQFNIDKNLSFQDLQGVLISGQYFVRPRLALRLGIDGYLNSSSSSLDNISIESRYNNWNISIVSQMLWYYGQKRSIFYWGVGPYFSKTREEGILTLTDTPAGDQLRWGKSRSDAFGASIVVGVEYYLANQIAFLLEYGLLISHSDKKVDFKDTPLWPSSLDSAASLPLKFGVAIYF